MDKLENILSKIRRFRDERDWMQFHGHKDMAVSIAIETGELLEHFQWKSEDEVGKYVETHKNEISKEIADIAIYLFELADNMDIDILKAIHKKLDENAGKYPVSKAKGKATKYNKLHLE